MGGAAPRLEETMLRPALNVRGLQSGNAEERAQNAIPTEARLSIDFRLVRLAWGTGYPAYRTLPSNAPPSAPSSSLPTGGLPA